MSESKEKGIKKLSDAQMEKASGGFWKEAADRFKEKTKKQYCRGRFTVVFSPEDNAYTVKNIMNGSVIGIAATKEEGIKIAVKYMDDSEETVKKL